MKVTNTAQGVRHFEAHNGDKVVTIVLAPGQVSDDVEPLPTKVFQGMVEEGDLTLGEAAARDAEAEEADLNSMTRAELDALAAERQIDVSHARSKADVIAVIQAAG